MSKVRQKRDDTVEDRNNMWRSIKCVQIAAQDIEEGTLTIQQAIYQSLQDENELEIDERTVKNIEVMIRNLLYFAEDFKSQMDSYKRHMKK